MDVQFEEQRLITSSNIDAEAGSFAADVVPFAFEKCRERFHKVFTEETGGFYFKHNGGQSRNIAAFVVKTEMVLEETTFSRFAETNRDTIMWITPSGFWKACPMRRSLLTVLLRCGILYDAERDNYEEALFTQEYIIPTKKAMMRFLFGFTKYTGPSLYTDSAIQVRGWKSIFEGEYEVCVRKLLIWPDQMTYLHPIGFSEALWN